MFSRNYKKYPFRDMNLFIDGVCKNKNCHTDEFRYQLTLLIKWCVEPEYIEAIYDAMTSPDNLDRTSLDFSVSVPQLSRKINKVKSCWGEHFRDWKFVSSGDYKLLQEYKQMLAERNKE